MTTTGGYADMQISGCNWDSSFYLISIPPPLPLSLPPSHPTGLGSERGHSPPRHPPPVPRRKCAHEPGLVREGMREGGREGGCGHMF